MQSVFFTEIYHIFLKDAACHTLLYVSLCKQTTIAKSFNADLIKAGFLFTKVLMFNLTKHVPFALILLPLYIEPTCLSLNTSFSRVQVVYSNYTCLNL